MDAIAGLPFYPLEISKDGKIFSPQQNSAIDEAVQQPGEAMLTDLFVVSHGWNNDMADARELYNKLFTNIVALIPSHVSATNRKFAVVGVFWPSKKFADEDLIPSGGAVSLEASGNRLTSSAINEKLDSLKGIFDFPDGAALDHAKTLVDALDDSPAKQREFVDTLRSVLPKNPRDTIEDASDKFMHRPGDELFKVLA